MGAYDLTRRVPGEGPSRNGVPLPVHIAFAGEGPGEWENRYLRPFSGPSGGEMTSYCGRAKISRKNCWVTNVAKYWTGPGNPDPTPEDIARDLPDLEWELFHARPQFLTTVGLISTRVFLGPDATMEADHGIPRTFDLARFFGWTKPCTTILIPVYHPAAGMHQPHMAAYSYRDFQIVGAVSRGEVEWTRNRYDFAEGREDYKLCHGSMGLPERICVPRQVIQDPYPELIQTDWISVKFELYKGIRIFVDTEGSKERPYCLTYSFGPGWARMIRAHSSGGALEDFKRFCQEYRPSLTLHWAQHDWKVLEAMGIDMDWFTVVDDTMQMSYEIGFLPQGLKALCRREHAMRMQDYNDLTFPYQVAQAHAYLHGGLGILGGGAYAACLDLPRPDPILEYKDGDQKIKRPLHIKNRKCFKEGCEDPRKAWFDIPAETRAPLEAKVGAMPDFTLDLVPEGQVVFYACRDADGTGRVHYSLEPRLEPVRDLYKQDRAIIPMTVCMEQTGMPVSAPAMAKISTQMDRKIARLQKQIQKYTGGEFLNVNSRDQVSALLYDKLGLFTRMLTKKGRVMSTNDKALEALQNDHPVIKLITGSRGCFKVKNSFSEVLPFFAKDDGCIHPTHNLTRTVTGRRSMKDPPLQAIPVREDEARQVRDAFVAPDDEFFGTGDLSQIEMRYMAHDSGDPKLCRLFAEGKDPHAITASQMFGIPLDKVEEHKHRDPAKRVGFGVITGISDKGLHEQFEMNGIFLYSQEDCNQMIIDWFKIYRGVYSYILGCREEARRRGFVTTMGGRPRYLPGIWSNIGWIRGEAERNSHSHKIQGSAAEILKKGEARFWTWCKPRLSEFRPCLTIHDELLVRGKKGQGREEELGRVLVACLTADSELLRVPLKAKYAYGQTWGSLK